MDFSSIKVGTRLTLAFGAVCLLLLVTVALGVFKMGEIHEANTLVVDNKLPKVQHAYVAITQVNQITLALRDLLMTSDPAEQEQYRSQVLEARRNAGEALAALERTVVTADGKAILADVIANRKRFIEAQNELMGRVEAKRDDAFYYLTHDLRAIQTTYLASLNKLVDHERRDAAAAGERANAAYAAARTLLIGLGLLAVALAATTAAMIVRCLLRQLGGEPAYAAHVANEIAAGNLTVPVRLAPGDTRSLLFAMNAMREQLTAVVHEVRAGTDIINTAAEEIAAGTQDLSSRTEQNASALEETASSLEELTHTVRENADNAGQANHLALAAATVAQDGGMVVNGMVERMSAINAASRSIVDIISVIDSIAFQTNILALNAAVEAARAGEQGRGFAVVASEVRTLAQRSATAAKEIKTLIDNSVEQVDAGSALVGQAGATMRSIIDSVQKVADIMREITVASAEQSDGLEQINKAVAQMDEATQQNAALVEEAAAAAASMQEQAASLDRTVGMFRLDGVSQTGSVATAALPRQGARQMGHGSRLASTSARRTDGPRKLALALHG